MANPGDCPSPAHPVITFRATPAERLAIRALAGERGVSISELIRAGLVSQGFEPASHRQLAAAQPA